MSIPRPPPIYQEARFASPEDQPEPSPSRPSYTPFPTQESTTKESEANRQSILVWADFINFEGPLDTGSQSWRNSVDDGQQSFYTTTSRRSSIDIPRPTYGNSHISEKALPEPPYHVFSLAQKKKLVYIISLAALFSPLSSNIYFPALGEISKVGLPLCLIL